jgi:hypothetical protein
MVRETSTCETIGTVMGNGRGSYRRSTQGQAVHERKRPCQINPNSFTPIRSYSQSRHNPSRIFEPEPDIHPPASGIGQQAISRNLQRSESVWEENGELVRGINVLEQLNAHMETDDNDNEARIASQSRMLTMHDPEFLTIPEADDENISTWDALKAPDVCRSV